MGKINSYPTTDNITDEEKFIIGRTLETRAVTFGTLKTKYLKEHLSGKLDVYQGNNANKILHINADGYIEPF